MYCWGSSPRPGNRVGVTAPAAAARVMLYTPGHLFTPPSPTPPRSQARASHVPGPCPRIPPPPGGQGARVRPEAPVTEATVGTPLGVERG